MLIRALQAAQNAIGYLDPLTLEMIALREGVPLYRVQEVASFFPSFRLPVWFKLTDQSLDTLRTKNVPEAVLKWLNPLKNKELQRADFGSELATVFESELATQISADEKEQFLNLILNHTRLPDTFKPSKPFRPVLHLCQSMTCHLKWRRLKVDVRRRAEELGQRHDGPVEVHGVSCLGRCDRAPAAMLTLPGPGGPAKTERLYVGLTCDILDELVTFRASNAPAGSFPSGATMDRPAQDPPPRDKTQPSPAGQRIEPHNWTINRYYSQNGLECPHYEALRRLTPTHRLKINVSDVVPILEKAKLVGMGGAAARTFKKWNDLVTSADRTRYVICNGDESEPGTFKDREILLRFPHLVIEGLLIAAKVVKAHKAFIYIRHEYQEQIAAANAELQRIRAEVPDIQKILAQYPVEVIESPGRYICGEESALIEALEGRRAQPRNESPTIREQGLFGHPTLVNNVETLAWVPSILLNAKISSESIDKAPLRRFFSVSGDVANPGVFEMSTAQTLGDLLEAAGENKTTYPLLAVATSGPSGGHLPEEFSDSIRTRLRDTMRLGSNGMRNERPDEADRVDAFLERTATPPFRILDFPLDVQVFRAGKLSLGAGVVFYRRGRNDLVDILSHAINCTEFFRDESCGKCVPCRLGTEQLVHLGKIAEHKADQARTVLPVLTATMRATSICSLGRGSAPTPLESYFQYFANGSSPLVPPISGGK